MGEMELMYLAVGVGLGLVGSRLTRSIKEPVVSPVASQPQQAHNEPVVSPVASQPQQAHKELVVSPVASQPQQANNEPVVSPVASQPQEAHKEPMVSPVASQPQQVEPESVEPLKEELKQTQLAYEMAKEMSQFKAGFLARTSHELRSPLSSLIGLHQLILADLCDSPEEAREFVAQANASALKMVKLLDEVIAVSKTEHGTNRLELRSQGLTNVFEDVHRLTYLQAGNRNLQLEVISPDPDIHVLVDPRRFRQVLVGIVDTAIAQMEDGSIKVSAACSPESKEAHIWIDVKSPNRFWSEPVDLLSTTPEIEKQPDETLKISPGLTLLMVQTLIEVMHGHLEVLPVSDEDTADDFAAQNFTRIQCSIPLATLECVEQESVED